MRQRLMRPSFALVNPDFDADGGCSQELRERERGDDGEREESRATYFRLSFDADDDDDDAGVGKKSHSLLRSL